MGVAFGHRPKKWGNKPTGGGADQADTSGSRDFGSDGMDIGAQRSDLGLNASSSFDDHHSLGRRSTRGPVNEAGTEFLFQARDVGRHIRLHRVQRPGSGGESAVINDGK
jgi:hypothetical protein